MNKYIFYFQLLSKKYSNFNFYSHYKKLELKRKKNLNLKSHSEIHTKLFILIQIVYLDFIWLWILYMANKMVNLL